MWLVSFSEPSPLSRVRLTKRAGTGLLRRIAAAAVVGSSSVAAAALAATSSGSMTPPPISFDQRLQHARGGLAAGRAEVEARSRPARRSPWNSRCSCSRTGRNPAAPSPPSASSAPAAPWRAPCGPRWASPDLSTASSRPLLGPAGAAGAGGGPAARLPQRLDEEPVEPGALRRRMNGASARDDLRDDVDAHAATSATSAFSASTSWRLAKSKKLSSGAARFAEVGREQLLDRRRATRRWGCRGQSSRPIFASPLEPPPTKRWKPSTGSRLLAAGRPCRRSGRCRRYSAGRRNGGSR